MAGVRSGHGSAGHVNPVPDDLLKSVATMLQLYTNRSNPPPTTADLAAHLGHPESEIKREIDLLEAYGLVSISATTGASGATLYTLTPEGTAALEEDGMAIRDGMVNALLWATTRIVKSDLGIDVVHLAGEVREDRFTTEDLSMLVGVTGNVEGIVYFGLNRRMARKIVEILHRRPPAGIDDRVLRVLNGLVDRIVGFVREDFRVAGYSVDVTSARTVRDVGSKITTLGIPQVVTHMRSEHGPPCTLACVRCSSVTRSPSDRDIVPATNVRRETGRTGPLIPCPLNLHQLLHGPQLHVHVPAAAVVTVRHLGDVDVAPGVDSDSVRGIEASGLGAVRLCPDAGQDLARRVHHGDARPEIRAGIVAGDPGEILADVNEIL